MVFVALCASICDANNWVDVARFGRAKLPWFRKFMPFNDGIPSHDTFTEVFARLDTLEFYAALQSWTGDIAETLTGKTVAFDGKTLRGSFDKACGKSALHSVSAWVCGLKMCIGLKSVEDKSNEIPAVQELIRMLDLKGAVVTADAMNCQRETAKAIIDKEADYVLTVKGNQETLHEELQAAVVQAFDEENPHIRTCKVEEKNRNRQELREVTVMPVPKNSPVFERWAGIKSIGTIYRTRELKGKFEESLEYFITSLECKVRTIAKHIRSHWGTENSQHHILDVTFGEDASRIRKGHSPEVAAAFRRMALNILQQDTSVKDNIRGKRVRAGWDDRVLDGIYAAITR